MQNTQYFKRPEVVRNLIRTSFNCKERNLELIQFVKMYLVEPKVQVIQDVYNDDEPVIEKVKSEKGEEVKINIDLRAQRSMIKLNTKTTIPAMCSIRTAGGARTGVDLICVLDVSGSMMGEKIQLVKETLKFLLEALTPQDRLSIITFNTEGQRQTPLKPVNTQNIIHFMKVIEDIQAGGGTTINNGLEIALKSIRERKYQNAVTSVFLLSDGQDKGADAAFKEKLLEPINKELLTFSIHCFGFGTDHDAPLMSNICDLRDGSFYYIKQLSTLDEAFCNALGGIITVIANQIVVKVNNIAKDLVGDIKIGQIYGFNCERMSEREFRFKMLQLMSGVSKDYIFELEIPAINTEVGDLDRNHDVIEAIFQAKGTKGEEISGECCLKLTLINENQEILEENQNVEVIENYLRVKTAQAIRENIDRANKSQYEEAQKDLGEAIKLIQENKLARKEKVAHLVENLEECRSKCNPVEYHRDGIMKMVEVEKIVEKQVNFPCYVNVCQEKMVETLRAHKLEKRSDF